MENNKKQTLIIDGDILNFTIGRATEDISDFGDQVCESFSESDMINLLENGLDNIAEKCGYEREDMVFAISCEKNYRKEHFPTYKSNRKDVKRPLGLEWLRSFQKENAEKYNLLMLENLEADDCMGILGTSGDDTISIYSQDKDLRTIPVRQWDFKTEKFWTPTEHESIEWLYTQVLTGDTVDGYKGCPKIGKVKAEKALRDCKNELEMLEQCFVRYNKVYPDTLEAKNELLKQIGQARILHQIDYIALTNFNETYNPFKILNVSDELLFKWSERYIQSLEDAIELKKKAKKAVKKVKKVKDAIQL